MISWRIFLIIRTKLSLVQNPYVYSIAHTPGKNVLKLYGHKGNREREPVLRIKGSCHKRGLIQFPFNSIY